MQMPIDQTIAKGILGGLFRKGLALLGPLVIETGWIDAEGWTALAIWVVPILVSVALTVQQKIAARQREAIALSLPAKTSLKKFDAVVTAQ